MQIYVYLLGMFLPVIFIDAFIVFVMKYNEVVEKIRQKFVIINNFIKFEIC